jgi:CheY-like chemotaxis protein
MPKDRIEVLLVEDSRADAELIRIMLEDTGIAHNIRLVTNGEQALSYLKREGDYVTSSAPDLLILDLNMPRMNGREFLGTARGLIDNTYVVVMSGSPEMIGRDIPHQGMAKPGTGEEIDTTVSKLKELMQRLMTDAPPI